MRHAIAPAARAACLAALLLPSACGKASAPAAGPPPEWPSPDPELSAPARDAVVAARFDAPPPLVDELEYPDGRRVPAAIVERRNGVVVAWVQTDDGVEQRRVPTDELAAVHAASREERLRARLGQLVEIEAEVDGSAPSPAVEALVPPAPPTTPAPMEAAKTNGDVTWEFTRVQSLGDLPGAIDVRWWPRRPGPEAGSAVEAMDTLLDRTGVWVLLTHRYGRQNSAILQVQIEATRVTFTHSPGYWGAPIDQLYDNWRVFVDGQPRLNFAPDPKTEVERGRFPYRTDAITLGSGVHVLRWELLGAESAATYFWAIDTIEWRDVVRPSAVPTWGALER